MAEEEEEPFFEGLSKFIKENKEFLLEVFGKWSKASSRQFYAKIVLVAIVVVMSGLLAGLGKITGETLAGIIGVVLGYVLGKGVF
jgi:hypothetical protein